MSTPTKDQAEAMMFEAQAEMYREQAALARKDSELRAAEARKKVAEAQKEEFYVESARISAASAKRNEDINLVQNHYLHTFNFNVGFNEESVEICEGQLAIWHRQDAHCDMTIKIDSPGGSVIDGLHLFDEITAYSLREWDTRDIPKGTHKTTIVVRGYAASMAGILLQAADERVMGPESSLLVHEVSTFASGKIGEVKDEVKWLDRLSERVANIFVARSCGKTSMEEFLAGWNRTDWWLDSEAALARGFIDRIG